MENSSPPPTSQSSTSGSTKLSKLFGLDTDASVPNPVERRLSQSCRSAKDIRSLSGELANPISSRSEASTPRSPPRSTSSSRARSSSSSEGPAVDRSPVTKVAIRRKSKSFTIKSVPYMSAMPSRPIQRLVLLMLNTAKIRTNRRSLVLYSQTMTVSAGVHWICLAFNLPVPDGLAMLQLMFEARILSRVSHSPTPALQMGDDDDTADDLVRLWVHDKRDRGRVTRFSSDSVIAKLAELEQLLQRLSPQEFSNVTEGELATLADQELRRVEEWSKTKNRLLGAKASSTSFHMPIVKSVEFLKALRDSADKDDEMRRAQYNYVIEVLSSGSFNVGRSQFFEDSEEGRQAKELMTQYSLTHYYNSAGATAGGVLEREGSLPRIDSAEEHAGMADKLSKEELAIVTDELMSELDVWGFDTMAFAKRVQRPLYFVGLALFTKYDLFSRCGVSLSSLRHFLDAIESRYHSANPYHNATHGADVAVSMHYFLSSCGIADLLGDSAPDDLFAAIVAALVHDVDHPGLNNNFIMVTNHPLALLHNDQSVLENHHLATAFSIVHDKAASADIFSGLDARRRRQVRDTIINLVLATDFSRHFEFLAEFEAKAAGENGFDMESRDDKTLLLSLALKAADIGHTAKPIASHIPWSKAILSEFFSQGKREEELNLPVSNNMDPVTTDIGKSQIGFIKFLVLPLLSLWAQQSTAAEPLLAQARDNVDYWTAMNKDEQEILRAQLNY
uniref:Phosphodiesterase n=1 Tax=Sexangularia sp. CB-2014 TaxID=1486929 RepID=A0A7S1YF31_9EUKA